MQFLTKAASQQGAPPFESRVVVAPGMEHKPARKHQALAAWEADTCDGNDGGTMRAWRELSHEGNDNGDEHAERDAECYSRCHEARLAATERAGEAREHKHRRLNAESRASAVSVSDHSSGDAAYHVPQQRRTADNRAERLTCPLRVCPKCALANALVPHHIRHRDLHCLPNNKEHKGCKRCQVHAPPANAEQRVMQRLAPICPG